MSEHETLRGMNQIPVRPCTEKKVTEQNQRNVLDGGCNSVTKDLHVKANPEDISTLPSASRMTFLKELGTGEFWRDILIELIATMFLLLAQCILPLSWGFELQHGHLVQTALGMCCIVTVMIEAFGPFSGAHMNPAVTLSMIIAAKISFLKGLLYVPAQCLGAIAGAGLVKWFTPGEFRETLAATTLNPGVSPWKAVIVELLITACLVLTIFGATNEKRKSVFLPSLPIGMAVMLGVLTGSPYTGGSMNPARSLGPAVIMNIWKSHWVYWVGPCLGGTLATLVYHYVFNYSSNKREESDSDSDEQDPFDKRYVDEF